mmetsp:Transcript_9000/g.18301  ORF Transcript_9000/g.18301 Transcript_9000/m.18301 type:complete len:296 (+) Transcript_9000:116-1003(+)
MFTCPTFEAIARSTLPRRRRFGTSWPVQRRPQAQEGSPWASTVALLQPVRWWQQMWHFPGRCRRKRKLWKQLVRLVPNQQWCVQQSCAGGSCRHRRSRRAPAAKRPAWASTWHLACRGVARGRRQMLRPMQPLPKARQPWYGGSTTTDRRQSPRGWRARTSPTWPPPRSGMRARASVVCSLSPSHALAKRTCLVKQSAPGIQSSPCPNGFGRFFIHHSRRPLPSPPLLPPLPPPWCPNLAPPCRPPLSPPLLPLPPPHLHWTYGSRGCALKWQLTLRRRARLPPRSSHLASRLHR